MHVGGKLLVWYTGSTQPRPQLKCRLYMHTTSMFAQTMLLVKAMMQEQGKQVACMPHHMYLASKDFGDKARVPSGRDVLMMALRVSHPSCSPRPCWAPSHYTGWANKFAQNDRLRLRLRQTKASSPLP